MLFNSYIFILFFLPICLIGYFTINHFKQHTLAQAFILGMSLWFYGYFNPWYIFIIVGSIIGNYLIYLGIIKLKKNSGKKAKVLMIVGIIANLALLGVFKYLDFMIANINAVLKTDLAFLKIALPLGISFFTFQQISFIVDSYREDIPKYNFIYYASFVAFFPQLIAGPIVSHDEMMPQFLDNTKKKINWENMGQGIYIFVLGFAKKVLLADTFNNAVEYGFLKYASLDSLSSILVMLAYTLQIYFDFSGYCDMAIGAAKMFNIDLPINFNSPYKALSIREFWQRWHITLSRFLTKYIYIPLGGSRKGIVRTCINLFIIFLVSGLWHGAAWTFVFWGAAYGVLMIIERIFEKPLQKVHPALKWLVTFTLVNVLWIFFRADSFSQATALVTKVFFWGYGPMHTELIKAFRTVEFTKIFSVFGLENHYPNICIALYYTVSMLLILGTSNSSERMKDFKFRGIRCFTTAFLFIWCLCSLTGINVFLYFNF